MDIIIGYVKFIQDYLYKIVYKKNSDYFKDKQIVLLLYYNNEFIHQYLEILKLDGMAICPYDYNTEYKAKEVYISTPPFCEILPVIQ